MTAPTNTLTPEALAELRRSPTVEALAQHLHDEERQHDYVWPEHPDDDGYRGNNAYVRITPTDIQFRCREEAARIWTVLGMSALLAAAERVAALEAEILTLWARDAGWAMQVEELEADEADLERHLYDARALNHERNGQIDQLKAALRESAARPEAEGMRWKPIDDYAKSGVVVDVWTGASESPSRWPETKWCKPEHECSGSYCDSCPEDADEFAWRPSLTGFEYRITGVTHYIEVPNPTSTSPTAGAREGV